MESIVESLRTAIKRALETQEHLFKWLRDDSIRSEYVRCADREDVELLKELIVYRIYPINAFEMLVRIDKTAALDMLLSRYVGRRVDPDTKFGGYTSELRNMLEDLVDAHGLAALEELLRHPAFNRKLLADKRVIDAIACGMDLSEEESARWAQDFFQDDAGSRAEN